VPEGFFNSIWWTKAMNTPRSTSMEILGTLVRLAIVSARILRERMMPSNTIAVTCPVKFTGKDDKKLSIIDVIYPPAF
jgi:hypothetical protein